VLVVVEGPLVAVVVVHDLDRVGQGLDHVGLDLDVVEHGHGSSELDRLVLHCGLPVLGRFELPHELLELDHSELHPGQKGPAVGQDA